MNKFKELPLEQRKLESRKIREKFPEKIPCLINTRGGLILQKYKYLVPRELTIGGFLYVLRNKGIIHSTDALFLFFSDGTIPRSYSVISEIYNEYKNDDGFLYFIFTKENTFGMDENRQEI